MSVAIRFTVDGQRSRRCSGVRSESQLLAGSPIRAAAAAASSCLARRLCFRDRGRERE